MQKLDRKYGFLSNYHGCKNTCSQGRLFIFPEMDTANGCMQAYILGTVSCTEEPSAELTQEVPPGLPVRYVVLDFRKPNYRLCNPTNSQCITELVSTNGQFQLVLTPCSEANFRMLFLFGRDMVSI